MAEDIQKEIQLLDEQNDIMLKRFEQRGARIDGLSRAYTRKFQEKLLEWGLITQDQVDEFELEWCTYLNEKLSLMEAEFFRRMHAQRVAQGGERATDSGLLLP